MRGFIAGAAVVVAIVVLVGASWNSGAGLPTLKDLPLAHSFNGAFVIPAGKPLIFAMPPSTGFVLTYLAGTENRRWTIRINGAIMRDGNLYSLGIAGSCVHSGGSGPLFPATASNPPIIVPPGGKLEISIEDTNANGIKLGGYFISRSDLGLP